MSLTLDHPPPTRLDAPQQDTGPLRASAPTPSGCRGGPRWFVVATYPQAERHAAHSLAQRGYRPYLPLVAVTRRDRVTRTMTRTVQIPLFSAYCFVRLDLRDPWYPVRYAPGVFKLLLDAEGWPQPVARGAVETLEATEAVRATPPPANASWAPGMPCRAAVSALKDVDAVVTDVRGSTATISLIMLGHMRAVTVPIDCLVAREG